MSQQLEFFFNPLYTFAKAFLKILLNARIIFSDNNMKINKKQFRHKIIYNMDSACINSVSLGTRKRNEMMVKTKEDFNQLINYQSLE